MQIYIDSADADAIGELAFHPAFAGVTTNPSLQLAAGLDDDALAAFLRHLLERGVRAVHIQVTSSATDEIVEQGLSYATLGEVGRVHVKIPATEAGLAAVGRLSEQGVPCTVTAAFEVEQVLLAATCGARYVAPYLGRMNDAGIDGMGRVRAMQAVLDRYGASTDDCRLLVASVRSGQDVRDLLQIGVGAITVKPELARHLLRNEATQRAEEAFLADANKAGQRR